MKGIEWDSYFKSLPASKRDDLRDALETLAKDEVITREFGISFLELASIIKYPLKQTAGSK